MNDKDRRIDQVYREQKGWVAVRPTTLENLELLETLGVTRVHLINEGDFILAHLLRGWLPGSK